MHKPLFAIAMFITLISSSACFTIEPPTAATAANCDEALKAFAKTRADAFSLDEWADWKWSQALRVNSLPVGPHPRLQKISEADYMQTVTSGQPAQPDLLKGMKQNFLNWSHGKSYISWEDTRRDEAADFQRHDRNNDGWVTRNECALSILPPPSLG